MRLSLGPQCRAAGPKRLSITCRFSGGDILGDGPNPNAKQARLIIPGRDTGPRPGGSLILPKSDGPGPGAAGGLIDAEDAMPVMRNFRPPPGFMNDGAVQEVEPAADADQMLNRIQSQSGHWHQLAKLFPALQRAGYDAGMVEERTGIERKLQNTWLGASSIYDSLAASGKLDPGVVAHFDQSGGEHLLYELRLLSLSQRVLAADYIARQGLDPPQAMVLARAMKEHERRSGARDGFAATAADCLAYKHYRDAVECRMQDDREKLVEKGLAVAETEGAKEKLLALLGKSADEVTSSSSLPAAMLTVVRLTTEEVGCRPVAVAGDWGSVQASAVRAAPKVSSTGTFAYFTLPPGGDAWRWVPLPAWSVLSLASQPVAIAVKDCYEVNAMRTFSGAKSESEMYKLHGEGIIVLDLGSTGVLETQYYAVGTAAGGVDLVDGVAAVNPGMEVLGRVLFVCRPPGREGAASATSELLSV